MAEEDNDDDSQKTEDPTERRLEKAFEEGQIAFSRELLHWIVLASSAVLILWVFPYGMKILLRLFHSVFEMCGDPLFSAPSSPIYYQIFSTTTLLLLSLFVIVFAVLGVGFGQTKLNFTLSQLMPKAERISPKSGLKKIFGKNAVVEFIKNIAKICLVAAVMLWAVWGYKEYIKGLSTLSLNGGLKILKEIFSNMFLAALSILFLIAGMDYIYQRLSHWKKLKMSRHDIKEEIKDQEGSPEIKSRIREIRAQRARARMASSVKQSTVVITNPTHYAIAIHWNEETMEAPKVVAKGLDYLALHIRKIAEENKVPIVENPPLARSLYEKIDIDQDIEPEHYRAVAEVIKYVSELKNKWF